MKASLKAGASLGFTIIEVMIVLAISGVILFSAILIFNGQQGQTEFSQAVNQFQTQLQATINDATNGYYPTSSAYQFSCSQPSILALNPPHFSSAPASQGTNSGCIFLGKAMQFAVSSSADTKSPLIDVYTIVGNQNEPGVTPTTPSQSVYDSIPVVLADTGGENINFPPAGIYTLENGAYIKCIEPSVYDPSNCSSHHSPTGAVAFAINSTVNPINTPAGSQQVTTDSAILLNGPGVKLGLPGAGMNGGGSTVQAINNALGNISTVQHGISICLIDNTRAAIISVGVNNTESLVNVDIVSINGAGACS
ncbi:MAG TPA: prepilin-type N-terminal cleavage/methylation domain-containing protein [Candidatus Saccharimonadales bacterium]|jgi:prepilin-type N-terminal cleavage/methylation domain-containing protein|nr:prepilin-type N-terminal cleavage/methylation domain-containing protein [Candidatus Saccharimonadales bacterium]